MALPRSLLRADLTADTPDSVAAIYEDLARSLEGCADDLEAALFAYAREPLTITDAEKLSGYSEETLRRAIRDGRLPNAGRPNSPRIAPRDLPKKIGGNGHG